MENSHKMSDLRVKSDYERELTIESYLNRIQKFSHKILNSLFMSDNS